MPRPDEGLIHAWLDGQLPPEEAARIEQLATTDPEWASAVAEARGLVAASSRILSALDRVPAGVVPKRTSARTERRLPWWTKTAAAVVVVAGGSVVVMQNVPDRPMPALSTEQRSAQPTPDTQKAAVEVPVASPPTTPHATRAPSVKPIVAEEPKAERNAGHAVAELSAPKSLVAKAAASATPSALPNAVQGAVPSIAPSAAPQSQQAATQDLSQAQTAVPAQRATRGVVAFRSEQGQQAVLCYRVVPDNLRGGTAILMHAVRSAGDTLFLAPVEPNTPQRAWLMLRDGMRGVMTTGGDLRSATPITGTPAVCPVP